MPTFGCGCGHVFRLSDIPSLNEYRAIKDERLVEASNFQVDHPEMSADEMYDYIMVNNRTILLCPICSRIHIEDLDDHNIFHPYISEELLYKHGVKYDYDLHLKDGGVE